jgi:hypothetical protein
MQFLAIKPREQRVEIVVADDSNAALQGIGLQQGKVDHGVIWHDESGGLGIIVDEFGLFTPASEQVYFAIGGRLYAGPALIYAFDEAGITVDFQYGNPPFALAWFENALDVEREIAVGGIERPEMRLDGELVWQWPQPRPPEVRV